MANSKIVKSRIIWALLWLNVALLIGWALKATSPTAMAQLRRPSDYLMIPGEIVGGDDAVIYVLDTTQGRLTAVSLNNSTGQLSVMPPIDMNQTFQAGLGGGMR